MAKNQAKGAREQARMPPPPKEEEWSYGDSDIDPKERKLAKVTSFKDPRIPGHVKGAMRTKVEDQRTAMKAAMKKYVLPSGSINSF